MAKFGGSAKNSDILQRVSPYARRLVAESIHTASSKMAPLTIYCQKVATSIMLMPLSRADIINAPITAPATLPMPPARLVPPMRVVERRSTDYRSLNDPSVIQAMHYIRNNACKGIKVEQVLDAVGISRSNLEKRFKEEVGETIHTVIHSEKLEKARSLLVSTSLSINEISQMCGYPSLQYFYSVFKKEYDVTPKEYRDRHSEVML